MASGGTDRESTVFQVQFKREGIFDPLNIRLSPFADDENQTNSRTYTNGHEEGKKCWFSTGADEGIKLEDS